jgi:hypothetical protein
MIVGASRLTFWLLEDKTKEVNKVDDLLIYATKQEAIDAWSAGGLRYKNAAPLRKIVFNNRADMAKYFRETYRKGE